MVNKVANWIVRNRLVVLAVLLCVTGFFAWKIINIDISTQLSDLLPQKHPYIKVHQEYEEQLGDPFKVYVMLSVNDDDIYDKETLLKIKEIDRELHYIPGVNHNQVYSIASRKVRKVTLKPDGVFVEQLMPVVPESDSEIKELQKTVRKNPGINSIWVSPDERSALFTVAFIPGRVDFKTVFAKVQDIIKTHSDANHRIYAAGEPMLVGWVYNYQNEMYQIFGITFLALFVLLYLYFRNLVGVVVPVISTLLGGLWGLGFCVLLGYNLEPLTLVIPLILMARALSHSVQITERYFECFHELKDVKSALVESISSILPPGILGIVTDAVGILLIAVAPVPIMQKLAYMCGYWALSIIFTGLTATPILLSFFPPSKNIAEIVDLGKGATQKILDRIAKLGYGRAGAITFSVMVLLYIGSGWFASKVNIGDVNPGTPILWQDSEYNVSIKAINDNFPGTDELYVIFEADPENPMGVFQPSFIEAMDLFQEHMVPFTARSLSLGDLLAPIQKYLYGGHPLWDIVPTSDVESRQVNFILKGDAAPDDFDKFFSRDEKSANVVFWFKDHMGDTIRNAITAVDEFIGDNKELLAERQVTVRLASGTIGLLAAMNETVQKSQFLNFVLVMSVIFVLCSITYRSFVAPLILMVPLNLTNLITLSIMHLLGIGLNINTLPIVSVGVGVGIDYGIYLLSRICEETQRQNEYSFNTAATAVKTTGKAIFFTATTMIAGVIFWYFFSSLRFQAEMGFLLALIMLANMLGALLLIPAIVSIFKPKFLKRVKLLVNA